MGTTALNGFELAARIARAATQEMGALLPRKVFAEAAAVLLPQMTFNRTRTALLKFAGVKLGAHSLILGPIRLMGSGNPCELVTIGSFTIVTGPLYLDLGAEVRIGDGVRIGHDVTLMTVTHEIGAHELRSGARRVGPIEIGNGAWIASRVTVLPDVTIGTGAVVAAGSVVTRDVPRDTLVAGVPARVVRSLDPEGHPRSSRRGADPHGMDPPLSERPR